MVLPQRSSAWAHQQARATIVGELGIHRSRKYIGAQHHARTPARRRVIDCPMPAKTKVSEIANRHRPKTASPGFAGQ
jgi:hypothetical protein